MYKLDYEAWLKIQCYTIRAWPITTTITRYRCNKYLKQLCKRPHRCRTTHVCIVPVPVRYNRPAHVPLTSAPSSPSMGDLAPD